MQALTHSFEEVRLIYRNKVKAENRPKISEARDAYNIFLQIWDHDQINLVEEGKLLLLDHKMRLMSVANIGMGGMTSVIIDLRMIFSIALKRRSNNIILAHNHPSGGLEPSTADLTLTRRVRDAGELLNIHLQDHLIVTDAGFHAIISEGRNFF